MNNTSFSIYAVVFITMLIGGCSKSNNDTGTNSLNHSPQISLITSDPDTIALNATTRLVCSAADEDGDSLSFFWECSSGIFIGAATESSAMWQATNLDQSSSDTVSVTIHVRVTDAEDTTWGQRSIILLTFDPYFDTGEPFIDEPDLNGVYNGIYDSIEPWIDRANEYGINNIGVYDPWDPYSDLNGNGRWDDGEIFYDLPSSYRGVGQARGAPVCNRQYDGPNHAFDEYELFTHHIPSDSMTDSRFPIIYTWDEIQNQPASLLYDWVVLPAISAQVPGYLGFLEGFSTWTDRDSNGIFNMPHDAPQSAQDIWYDTGEPFMDIPDSNGYYNGVHDANEPFWDMPSSYTGPFSPRLFLTTNGAYDGPNEAFDEYELFTCPYGSIDPRFPVYYTWEDVRQGIRNPRQWLELPDLPSGVHGYLAFIPGKSTWIDGNGNEIFDIL